MDQLDPCLAGCDQALTEAERMLAMLAATGTAEDSLAPVRASIARLQREVGRLRGLKVAPAAQRTSPMWTDFGPNSPWNELGTARSD